MITDRLKELGYEFAPAPLEIFSFHAAVRTGNLVFTSDQVPVYGDLANRGRVGDGIDVQTAAKAAEVCAVNCVRAVAAVADPDTITRIVKVVGMVNVAPGFNDTSGVINGATNLMKAVLGECGAHARSAIGMVLPNDRAVEVELVAEVEP